MYPNEITWLKYGRNAFGKHLICLRSEMNTQVGGVATESNVPDRNAPNAHLPMHIP